MSARSPAAAASAADFLASEDVVRVIFDQLAARSTGAEAPVRAI